MKKVIAALIVVFCILANSVTAYELCIAAIFKNEGPYLQEWIEYHKMVGVEHFWLYNDGSTDNWKDILQPYILEGLVEVIEWPVPTQAHFIQRQVNAYKDALAKACSKTTWIALIDIDEFLLPKEEKSAPECLNKNFSHASAIYVNWFHFGTGGITLQPNESILFGLTACAHPRYPQNRIGKSIVRPNMVAIDKVWNGHHFVLKPKAQYCNGDGQYIPFKGVDLALDGKIHNKFIRLNHYYTRDEYFFKTTRYPRSQIIGIPSDLVMRHYRDFNTHQDHAIINFIKQKHPQSLEKFWKQKIFNYSRP